MTRIGFALDVTHRDRGRLVRRQPRDSLDQDCDRFVADRGLHWERPRGRDGVTEPRRPSAGRCAVRRYWSMAVSAPDLQDQRARRGGGGTRSAAAAARRSSGRPARRPRRLAHDEGCGQTVSNIRCLTGAMSCANRSSDSTPNSHQNASADGQNLFRSSSIARPSTKITISSLNSGDRKMRHFLISAREC